MNSHPLTLDEIPDTHPLHPRTDPPKEKADRLRLDFRMALLDWTHRALLLVRDSARPALTADCLCYELHFEAERGECQGEIAKRNGVTERTVRNELRKIRKRLTKQKARS